jgi:hypothetical protein
MADIHDQIARLQHDITRLQAEVADLEADVLDLQRELDTFKGRYDRLVRPLIERLELVQDLIEELETKHSPPPPQLGGLTPETDAENTWTPPPGYRSVEEQFQRAWRKPENSSGLGAPLESDWTPPQDYVSVEEQFRRTWRKQSPLSSSPVPPATGPLSPQALKSLYRQLARRFHPDLTTDPVERERRNRLMAEINAAYSRRDLIALQTLAAQSPDMPLDQPLAAIQLRQLQQIREQLLRRIDQLKHERHTILNSELMDLKLQDSLGAKQGGDVLQTLADQLERDYAASLRRLDELRGL